MGSVAVASPRVRIESPVENARADEGHDEDDARQQRARFGELVWREDARTLNLTRESEPILPGSRIDSHVKQPQNDQISTLEHVVDVIRNPATKSDATNWWAYHRRQFGEFAQHFDGAANFQIELVLSGPLLVPGFGSQNIVCGFWA
jgi:hypothetical protein